MDSGWLLRLRGQPPGPGRWGSHRHCRPHPPLPGTTCPPPCSQVQPDHVTRRYGEGEVLSKPGSPRPQGAKCSFTPDLGSSHGLFPLQPPLPDSSRFGYCSLFPEGSALSSLADRSGPPGRGSLSPGLLCVASFCFAHVWPVSPLDCSLERVSLSRSPPRVLNPEASAGAWSRRGHRLPSHGHSGDTGSHGHSGDAGSMVIAGWLAPTVKWGRRPPWSQRGCHGAPPPGSARSPLREGQCGQRSRTVTVTHLSVRIGCDPIITLMVTAAHVRSWGSLYEQSGWE